MLQLHKPACKTTKSTISFDNKSVYQQPETQKEDALRHSQHRLEVHE